MPTAAKETPADNAARPAELPVADLQTPEWANTVADLRRRFEARVQLKETEKPGENLFIHASLYVVDGKSREVIYAVGVDGAVPSTADLPHVVAQTQDVVWRQLPANPDKWDALVVMWTVHARGEDVKYWMEVHGPKGFRKAFP